MSIIKIKLVKYVKLIIILTIVFTSLKFLAYSLPDKNIQANIEKSIVQLKNEGCYPKPFYYTDNSEFAGQQLDNFTDAIYLNVAYIQSEMNVLRAVAGDLMMAGDGENPIEQLSDAIERKQQGEEIKITDYSRQWFGGEVILRTLLLFFTYPQIRIIMQINAIVLLIVGCLSLLKNIGRNAMWAYLIGMLCISPMIAASSINLANSLFVMMIGVIIISKLKDSESDVAVMLLIGGATAYFDLFATPFLTYAVCVQIFLMKTFKQQKMHWTKSIIYLIKISMGWLSGYLLLWMAKWCMASLILDRNLFQDAFNEMRLYTSERRVSWGPSTSWGIITEALKLNVINIFPINIMHTNPASILFFVTIVSAIVIWRVARNKTINLHKNLYIYLLAALAPYVWYTIVHVHSFIHFWFQYRLQAGTIIGITFVYLELTERKQIS